MTDAYIVGAVRSAGGKKNGRVSQVGAQSSNIGRNVCLSSVLGEDVPGTTVDRQCGSGQQAIHFAAQAAVEEGRFNAEIVPIEIELEDGSLAMHTPVSAWG